MTMTRLIRSELRKLTSTKMPVAFLGVLVVLAGLNAFAVIAIAPNGTVANLGRRCRLTIDW